MIIEIELDRDKILDEAIFMAIEAKRKCEEGFGPIASERINRAINRLKWLNKELDECFSKSIYPSKEYLESKDFI